jgi:DNA invertase Pin-like site-specific DNA recombinase
VLPRELSLPSGSTDTSSAMMTLPLALLKLLFTMFAALSERERLKRSEGRAENRSCGVNEKAKWSAVGAVYVAVAVALIAWPGGGA